MRQHLPKLALVVAAALACSDTGSDPDEPPGLTVAGRIETGSSVPVVAAEVWLRVWDTTTATPWANVTLITDSAGRFSAVLPIDTLLASGYLQADVTPPFGSGLSRGFAWVTLTFDSLGQADTSGLAVVVTQLAPPIPEGPPSALDPALLTGDYSGSTVPPSTIVSEVYLDLSLTAVGDSVHGRYDIDFSASTACGDGFGQVTGNVLNDTLFLRLASDSFPGWGGTPLVNSFIATTYSASADTLILHYPASPGQCPWGSPAPLRLIRQ